MGRLLWWLLTHVRLGPLTPYVFELMIGKRPRRIINNLKSLRGRDDNE